MHFQLVQILIGILRLRLAIQVEMVFGGTDSHWNNFGNSHWNNFGSAVVVANENIGSVVVVAVENSGQRFKRFK